MNSSTLPILPFEGKSGPQSQRDEDSDSPSEDALSPRCNAELSALRSMLPKHPEVVDAVSRAIAAILSHRTELECTTTLVHVLRRRIAADLQIVIIALYHAELCAQSTTQLSLHIDRLRVDGQDGTGPPVLYPDHPFRHSRLSLESLLSRNGAGAEEPQIGGQPVEDFPTMLMPQFLRRVHKCVDGLCRISLLDECVAHGIFEKVVRDLGQAQALNDRIDRWYSAVQALKNAMHARGTYQSLSTVGVDSCAQDVAALAAALVEDVEKDGVWVHLAQRKKVRKVKAVRNAEAGKAPRRQLAYIPRARPVPLMELELVQDSITQRSTYRSETLLDHSSWYW